MRETAAPPSPFVLGVSGRGLKGATPLNADTAPRAQEAGLRAPPSTKPEDRIRALEEMVLHRLDEDKAQDVVFIDLKGKSAVADGLIVASGRSHRHVGAMADHLLRALKDEGYGKVRVEGMPHCDWVLIDTGDVIVHLFRPEVRTFYNIEKIWAVEPPPRTAAL
jgi:ribosome-associated protein